MENILKWVTDTFAKAFGSADNPKLGGLLGGGLIAAIGGLIGFVFGPVGSALGAALGLIGGAAIVGIVGDKWQDPSPIGNGSVNKNPIAIGNAKDPVTRDRAPVESPTPGQEPSDTYVVAPNLGNTKIPDNNGVSDMLVKLTDLAEHVAYSEKQKLSGKTPGTALTKQINELREELNEQEKNLTSAVATNDEYKKSQAAYMDPEKGERQRLVKELQERANFSKEDAEAIVPVLPPLPDQKNFKLTSTISGFAGAFKNDHPGKSWDETHPFLKTVYAYNKQDEICGQLREEIGKNIGNLPPKINYTRINEIDHDGGDRMAVEDLPQARFPKWGESIDPKYIGGMPMGEWNKELFHQKNNASAVIALLKEAPDSKPLVTDRGVFSFVSYFFENAKDTKASHRSIEQLRRFAQSGLEFAENTKFSKSGMPDHDSQEAYKKVLEYCDACDKRAEILLTMKDMQKPLETLRKFHDTDLTDAKTAKDKFLNEDLPKINAGIKARREALEGKSNAPEAPQTDKKSEPAKDSKKETAPPAPEQAAPTKPVPAAPAADKTTAASPRVKIDKLDDMMASVERGDLGNFAAQQALPAKMPTDKNKKLPLAKDSGQTTLA